MGFSAFLTSNFGETRKEDSPAEKARGGARNSSQEVRDKSSQGWEQAVQSALLTSKEQMHKLAPGAVQGGVCGGG